MQILRSVFLACMLLVLHIGSLNAQWVPANGPYGGTTNCIVANDTDAFAGTYGGVFRSTDNGESWTAVNNGLTNKAIYALVMSGSNIFAGTGGG
ncbi:MAG: hypothetical protein PHN50_12410, partial [Bacteroidales bacterium]|nr:hypothetical protein [Bacteroidales bacterium]